MPRTKTSKRWLQEHFADFYVKKAQAEGYRSRAVYKLKQVNDKESFLKPGMLVVDLGAAPGGWSQVVAEILQDSGQIIALDILPMEPIGGVNFIQGDFTEDSVFRELFQVTARCKIDVLLSDMAPNMSGSSSVDIPKAMYLCELAFDFALKTLKPGGGFFMKTFHGEGFDDLVKAIRCRFEKVIIRKPDASRPRSRETYLLAKGHIL